MKIDDLIVSYYKRILENKSRDEVNKIVKDINSLTYIKNGEKISYEDKLKIADGILLLHESNNNKSVEDVEERAFEYRLEIPKYLVLEHSSNDEVLTLCSIVHDEILKQKGNKK